MTTGFAGLSLHIPQVYWQALRQSLRGGMGVTARHPALRCSLELMGRDAGNDPSHHQEQDA